MPRDGSLTREKILDAAEALILDQGYGGMSLDAVIEGAGITKGAFFYHFANKQALARALVERYALQDTQHLDLVMARAAELSDDAAGQLVALTDLLVEELSTSDLSGTGCLYAAFVYQNGLLEAETLHVARDAMLYWREKLRPLLAQALEDHPPTMAVTADDLVDQLLVAFEGGFVMGRSFEEPDQVARALRHFRNYLVLLFGVEPATLRP